MTEVRDRAGITSAAMLLFVATLVIVVDVRMPDLDIIADVIGGALVVIAALRIHGAILGASPLRSALVVLAAVALPVTILETMTPATGVAGVLIGRVSEGGTFESPLAILLLGVLAIPLIVTLHALWRTAQGSTASSPAPST